MADLYSRVTGHPAGAALTKRLGLPQPATLRRGRRWPGEAIALGAVGGGDIAARTLHLLGLPVVPAVHDAGTEGPKDGAGSADSVPAYAERLGALVLDATMARTIADLEQVRAMLRPALKALGPSGRVIVVGVAPHKFSDVQASAVGQALEGITRSVGKEMRHGGTANLVQVADSTAEGTASTLAFLLQGRSAYVSGQPLRVGNDRHAEHPAPRPFEGRVVVVTGAARGIGAAIAEVFARDGAEVVTVDVPSAGDALAGVANRVSGMALQLDITNPDAGQVIARHVAERFGDRSEGQGRIHAIVHNAGITRDKLLANTDATRWAGVLEVNLQAALRINEALLDPWSPGGLSDGGRIVNVASTSGIAGNRGQANYAASKAGVIGATRALAPHLRDRRITVNAVAPGFIETEMTGKIPVATREFARRFNSMHQAGKPVDVAEAIAYFADPASSAVNGQVLRVCGQSQIGA
ncbi:MAG TPA: 3-oxoacyl-ACP reductase [Ornithinimicrobium sp.]|uniref:3-oxoacyl-ACP reductase n=1 Tax=Ornithinimicrobium sp. TaxID=1977084 RepID=UPI002B49267E|nr:3-oxoacyl-ACP reductase [Ornithinimicrobium sp.]HKJ11323.1 3-oxoacyl-ACP reductase [Ornithinimicrobium sp.]